MQVLKEKKEAHRRYQQSLEVEQRNKNNAAQGADTAVDESTFVFVEGPVSGQLLEQGSTVGSAELVDRKPANSKFVFFFGGITVSIRLLVTDTLLKYF